MEAGELELMRHHFAHVQRPVGVRDIKFRSKAEANYAAYLEWLVSIGEVAHWDYEPETFWFDPATAEKYNLPGKGVRRGVTSYRPDFRVRPTSKAIQYHEVKGYLDARSRVALKRMAKYYPEEKVVVIDSKQMAALERQVGGIVPGWIP